MGRQLATLLLIGILALSGCTLLGAPTTPTETPTTATPAEATPSPTPTATPVPYPSGYGPNGITDADAAVKAHTQGVLAHESFIVEYNGSAVSNGSIASVTTLQTANRSTDRAYVISTVGGRGTTVQYFENDTVYTRNNPPGSDDITYSNSEFRFRPAQFTGTGLVAPFIRHVEYDSAERFESENGTFIRYRSTNLTATEPLLGEGIDPSDVRNVEVGIVVSEDGVVQRAAYRATVERDGEPLEMAVKINVLGFGSTTVDRPTWYDEAANS